MKAPPAFLLIDAGSTRLKWATANARGPIRLRGCVTIKEVTPKRISALAKKFSRQSVVLASVVPKLNPTFRRAFAGRLELVHGASTVLGLEFDYPKPVELGADRLAMAVAAKEEKKWPVIVVSCGTATAFTVIDAQGRLCGGVIAPGLRTQLEALLGATAQLPATILRPLRRALAKSTQEAISSGTVLNFQGGVEKILDKLSAKLPKRPRVLVTGGDAPFLGKLPEFQAEVRPLLVFEGLRMIGVLGLDKS